MVGPLFLSVDVFAMLDPQNENIVLKDREDNAVVADTELAETSEWF